MPDPNLTQVEVAQPDLPYARHVDAYVRGDGTGFFMDCPRCHFYENAVMDEGDTCRASGCGGTVRRIDFRITSEIGTPPTSTPEEGTHG